MYDFYMNFSGRRKGGRPPEKVRVKVIHRTYTSPGAARCCRQSPKPLALTLSSFPRPCATARTRKFASNQSQRKCTGASAYRRFARHAEPTRERAHMARRSCTGSRVYYFVELTPKCALAATRHFLRRRCRGVCSFSLHVTPRRVQGSSATGRGVCRTGSLLVRARVCAWSNITHSTHTARNVLLHEGPWRCPQRVSCVGLVCALARRVAACAPRAAAPRVCPRGVYLSPPWHDGAP
jgi:hypothetical protein